MRAVAVALVLALLLLAGCGQPLDEPAATTGTAPSNPEGPPANATAPPARPPAVLGLAAAPAVLVSVAGHRTSEFTVAADPVHPGGLLATAMDWDSGDATVQCAAYWSADAGGNWTAVPALPGHAAVREDTDPWVAFDATGRAYLTCSESGVGMLLGQSADGGRTWEEARLVPTGGSPIKGAIGAFGAGELVVCYQQGGAFQVLHSLDRGGNWTATVFPGMSAGCNGVQRDAAGTTYVLWQSGGALEADNLNPAPPGVGILYSNDGARTWAVVHLQDELGAAPANMQSAPQAAAPSLAISPVTGAVFVAAQQYQNAEAAGPFGTESRALSKLWRSTDRGRTFEEVAVPQVVSAACGTSEQLEAPCNQVHPTLACDALGHLAFQFVLSDGTSLRKQAWVAVSGDDGATWPQALMLSETGPDRSYLLPGNAVPTPEGVVQQARDVAADPAAAQSAATARADSLTWPVFHRDGGEYFGIAPVPGGVADLWVEHDADGRNQILSRRLSIES
ncbi:MAG: repeat-like domain [Thermoplasmata archaeon]|nr:repeat-like domain [Thermoplasmata archaeon]